MSAPHRHLLDVETAAVTQGEEAKIHADRLKEAPHLGSSINLTQYIVATDSRGSRTKLGACTINNTDTTASNGGGYANNVQGKCAPTVVLRTTALEQQNLQSISRLITPADITQSIRPLSMVCTALPRGPENTWPRAPV